MSRQLMIAEVLSQPQAVSWLPWAVQYFFFIGIAACAALIEATVLFPYMIFRLQQAMLKSDGYSWWQRRKLSVKGLWWLLKPVGGLMTPLLLACHARNGSGDAAPKPPPTTSTDHTRPY